MTKQHPWTKEEYRELRNQYGLSQVEFANITGMASTSIQRYETGASHPIASNAKLYSVLRKNPDLLIHFADTND